MTCNHQRYKKNYPFGRKSEASLSCKDCGSSISKIDLKKKKEYNRKRR